MLNQDFTYTPEEVADILKVNKNTVYELIKSGEISAKKLGRVYRIPATSLSFVFAGVDYDLYLAEQEDLKKQDLVRRQLKKVRQSL